MKIIPRKRRMQAKTNYLKRKRLLYSKRPRIVIRKTNKNIIIQFVETKIAQDNVKVNINSKELLKYGWKGQGNLKSVSAAYLTGLLFGNKIKDMPNAILDTGLIINTKGSRVYAALKGIVDSGYEIKHDEKIFPSEEKIKSKDFFEEVKKKIMEK